MVQRRETEFTIGRKSPTVVMTRVLDAPRELVFRTLTETQHLTRWWGSFVDRDLESCQVDLRPGGQWRTVEYLPNGRRLASGGSYVLIDPPSRIVQTLRFESDPWKGQSAEITYTLRAVGRRTRLTITTLFPSFTIRDGMDVEGVRSSGLHSLDRLAHLLVELGATTRTSPRRT